jgi:uracil-DNA glycosylase
MSKLANIDDSWYEVLEDEFTKDYFINLKSFLVDDMKSHTIYPPSKLIFNAFDSTPFNKVKVVILGQDPYHGEGQAHGLSFSVPEGINKPPSLRNILGELRDDLGIPVSNNGCLQSWANQGVLLLNATLTVRKDAAGSHQGKGWEIFTDRVISLLSEKREKLVFMLWGNYARNKKKLIDSNKHLILEASHPSPLSSYRGFFGCRHFSKTNNYLRANNIEEISWQIPVI